MQIEPRHLMQVAAIVDAGSFAGAAARLGSSQPAISRDITALEARLGIPLFDRSVRPVEPTALGEALAEEGSAILFARDQAALKIERMRAGTAGVLRIVGPPLVMDHVVTPMFASFHAKHPAVEIHMQPGYVSEAMALVRTRKVDLALCAVTDIEEEGIDFLPLISSRNVIACRLNHPLTRVPDLQLSAIRDYGWVSPPRDSPLERDLRASLARLGGTTASIRFRSGTSAGIRTYLETTDCLSILPESVTHTMSKHHDVTSLQLELPGPSRYVGILKRSDVPETRLATRMRTHLTHAFEALTAELEREIPRFRDRAAMS